MKKGFDERAKTLLYFVISFLIGFVVWWKTTEVHRANLPLSQMQQLSIPPKEFNTFNISIFILSKNEDSSFYSQATLKQFEQTLEEKLNFNLNQRKSLIEEEEKEKLNLRLSIESKTIFPSDKNKLTSIDEVDDWIESNFGTKFSNGNYGIFVLVSKESICFKHSNDIIWGKYRHSFLCLSHLNPSEIDELSKRILSSSKRFLSQSSDFTQGIAMRPSPEYRISFSLLNENPEDRILSWNFETTFREYLHPLIQRLNPFIKISTDSQILQYSSLMQKPSYDSTSKYYYLKEASLSHFINPRDWKLDFTDSKTIPVINFILFVPGNSHSPLFIKKNDGRISTTNSFIIPQFGGVSIFNISQLSNSSFYELNSQDLLPIMQIFVEQLRELLGIEPIDGLPIIPATRNGIAKWEVDILVQRYTWYFVHTSISSLQSLSNLVKNLTNMIIEDNIGHLCNKALDSLSEALEQMKKGNLDEALLSARTAFVASEEAFFDPNMLSMLYFPDEHKMAVYALPFFPILFQLFSGLWGEFKERRKRKT